MPTLHRNVSDILRGSAGYLVSGILASAAPFFVSLLVSRYLGKEALGLFSVCFALVLAGVLVSDLGLNSFIMREFAGTKQPENANLRTLLRVRTSASLVAATCLSAFTFFFVSSSDPFLLSTAAFVLIVLRSVAGGLENVAKARLYRITYAVVTISGSTAHVLLVYLVLNAGYGIQGVFLAMAAVEIVKALLLLWIFRTELVNDLETTSPRKGKLRLLLIQGLPFALIGIFTLVNDKAALFFLTAIRGSGEAGLYSAADRFLIVGMLVDSSLFASALPALSLFTNRLHMHRVTSQTLIVVVASAIVGTIVLIAGAPLLIGLTFRYSEAIWLLQILALSLPALLLSSILRIALISMHQERRVAVAFGISAVITIILNAALIPHYGATGAAVISVIVKYGVGLGYGALYLRSVHRSIPSRQDGTYEG